jgi:uncharacterized protein with ATP-grasp and redox domains
MLGISLPLFMYKEKYLMKAHLDCIVCQQRQALRILQLATEDQHLHESVLRQVMDYLLHTEWTADPMTISRGMYEIINRATKNPDPYKALKYQSNQEVLECYPELRERIQTSEDPLLTACKLAIAGNIMDFGARDHFNLQETIQHVLETDFAINDYHSFKSSLHNASRLLLFADNAGEIVFDKLLLETILQHYPLCKLTVVVKGFPIINDATMEDVRQIGLPELPNIDFRLVNTNGNERSTWISPEVTTWIQNHDVIIAKGQANYEVLSDIHGLYFLLIAKCGIVADDTGTYNGALIFKYN